MSNAGKPQLRSDWTWQSWIGSPSPHVLEAWLGFDSKLKHFVPRVYSLSLSVILFDWLGVWTMPS